MRGAARELAPSPREGDPRSPSRRADGATAQTGRGVLFGSVAAIVVALIWMVAAGLANVTAGLLVLALVGGYGIGTATAYGSWGEAPHDPLPTLRLLGAGLGVAAWLLGTFLDYLIGLAVIPGSTSSLGEKMAAQPYPVALAAQFGLLDVAAIALLAGFAWRAAR